MALPRQVAQRIKEVEDIERQLSGETQQPEPSVEEAEVVEQPEPEAELAQEPETPEVAPEPEVEKPEKPEEDAAVWRQKYKTLQGMYDKEVPQLHSQVKDLKAELNKISEAMKAKQEEEVKAPQSLVTDEDVQNFGEDLISVQRKVAQEVAAQYDAKLEAYEAKIAKLEESLGTTQSSVAESSFESRLHRLVPNFSEVNADPKWIAWLDEVDPVLRAPRRSVAEQAYQSGDAEGVAYYVDMFNKTIAPEPEPEVVKPNKELESQIQPSRKAASNAPTSQKGKNYTTAQITQMFNKAARLSSTGKVDEANKLEAEIDSAYMQGRVIG